MFASPSACINILKLKPTSTSHLLKFQTSGFNFGCALIFFLETYQRFCKCSGLNWTSASYFKNIEVDCGVFGPMKELLRKEMSSLLLDDPTFDQYDLKRMPGLAFTSLFTVENITNFLLRGSMVPIDIFKMTDTSRLSSFSESHFMRSAAEMVELMSRKRKELISCKIIQPVAVSRKHISTYKSLVFLSLPDSESICEKALASARNSKSNFVADKKKKMPRKKKWAKLCENIKRGWLCLNALKSIMFQTFFPVCLLLVML